MLLAGVWWIEGRAAYSRAASLAVAAPPMQRAQLSPKQDNRWRTWQALPATIQAKVDPRILAELRGEVLPAHLGGTPQQPSLYPTQLTPLAQTRFLIYLRQELDVTTLQGTVFASQAAQRNALFASLTAQAEQAQAPLRSWLISRVGTAMVTAYQPFVVINAIAVEGSLESVIALAQHPDVARLVANYPLVKMGQVPSPALTQPFAATAFLNTAQTDPWRQLTDGLSQPTAAALDPANWNIQLVRADRVWNELGVRGEGAVVAGFDTGVDFRHPALVKQYRGNLQNGQFNHNYQWFEPDGRLYADGNLGASLSTEPEFCDPHGTHTMGTAVGDGGVTGTQVGMAPGAQWIAVPGICYGTMSGGIRDDIGGIKAFQWLLCPTDLTGNLGTADCSKAPDVVNNSWGSANPTNEVLRPAIQALRAMNIAPVFAAGNPRAGAGSIGTPANAPEAITVGATDSKDVVASFSGRGPSFYAGEQKPELSAPGVNVRSTVMWNGYEAYSGTSMAAPHVAGLIALLVSADLRDGVRDFTVDELESFMTATAVDRGAPGPDNDYGYGRIDAYGAVRWVLSAGDLRGTIRSQVDNSPIAQAKVTGRGAGNTFQALSGATGLYSVTVPGGAYDLTVAAWGYYSRTFAGQAVFAGSLSLADFSLNPLPTASVQGVVRHQGMPVANALLYLAEQPQVRTQTDSNGTYALTLPVGQHTLVVQEAGYRMLQTVLAVSATGVTQDLAVESAPSILLVEADAYRGWFEGWPIGSIFTWALDQQGYAYDRWRIEDASITDTVTLIDGSVAHGVPSTTTLQAYDLVIWAQSGCDSGYFGCFYRSSPVSLGADDSLRAFLDGGGRLILSGQDIGNWDEGTTFYDDYLNIDVLLDNAAVEGDTITGSGFLQNLALTVTNASLYGYRNGSIALSPDALTAGNGPAAVYPVLLYDQSEVPAAVAIDTCAANYRAVYLGVGFENIGPRASNRDPAIAEVLGRSIRWASASKPALDFAFVAAQTMAMVEPGQIATYPMQLVNTGSTALTIQLASSSTAWVTQILSGTQELTGPITLAPCQRADLVIRVETPTFAFNSETMLLTVTAAAVADPALTHATSFRTTALVHWQTETAMPNPRYALGVVAPPNGNELYAVGGWKNMVSDEPNTAEQASAAIDRYNVCTQRWEALSPMPAARANGGVALLNGKIYVVGGNSYNSNTDYYSYPTYATLFVYDLASGQWSTAASLPKAYTSMAVAVARGKLYAFGGMDATATVSNRSYEYDPTSDRWTEKAPMPGGGRYLAAAANVSGNIYVVGGWDSTTVVEIYDPLSNTWRNGAKLQRGRHSLGLTTAPDGYLYAIGGAAYYWGEASIERYDPTANRWEMLSALQDGNRYGVAAAYAGGRIYAIGGANVGQSTESLRVSTAFCLSEQTTQQAVVGIGSPISYTVTLRADRVARPNASYVYTLPPKTTFGGFTANLLGASFNPATQQIEWRGALAAQAPPQSFGYVLNSDAATILDQEILTSTARFDNGAGLVFTQTTATLLLAADLSRSRKQVDRSVALAGEVMTYTIQLQGATFVAGEVSIRDPLPATLTYVPDTLTYSEGSGAYDPASHSIVWTGRTQSGPDAYLNLGAHYAWGDSGKRGEVPVTYQWLEIGETGTALSGGDVVYTCGLPIGFGFPFYGKTETEFCVSTNGFISFQRDGLAADLNDCPLPSSDGNEALIAAVWDDLVIEEGIRYQTLGQAPNRSLVVQWNGARAYGSNAQKLATFQLVLFENGLIRVALREAGLLRGALSTTGIEDYTATTGVTYACNTPNTLSDQQAILFVPPGGSTSTTRADIRFQAYTTGDLRANVPLTNTVLITTANAAFQRQVTTLINPLHLQTSAIGTNVNEVSPGGTVLYRAALRNTGLLTATNASFTLPIPANMGYVEGSLQCDQGQCQQAMGVIQWRGPILPSQETVILFALQLTTGLPDRTPVLVDGVLEDGFGQHYPLTASILARRSDLQASLLQLVPAFVEPQSTSTVQAFIRNNGGASTTGAFQLLIPTRLTYVADSLACGVGSCTHNAGTIEWQGAIDARAIVPIRFRLRLPDDATYGDTFTVAATVRDVRWNESYPLTATLTVAHNFYLPFSYRADEPLFRFYFPFVPR
ncbi:MAG: S8 family serine peptidase [Caldilineaceae bacterium]|nr:S8 family serine peptidase [Caldilineaceae bacterium]